MTENDVLSNANVLAEIGRQLERLQDRDFVSLGIDDSLVVGAINEIMDANPVNFLPWKVEMAENSVMTLPGGVFVYTTSLLQDCPGRLLSDISVEFEVSFNPLRVEKGIVRY